MKSFKSFAVVISISTLFSASCGKTAAPPASSSAGALTANSSLNSGAPVRPFGRHSLNSAGSTYLNDFIRPDVRARLDEEPGGDADGSYDPSTVDPASSEQASAESGGETQNQEAGQPRSDETEDSPSAGPRVDTLKYSWAKKAFGEAIKAVPTNNGVIVLYADENYYDVERLMGLVEEGRNRIAENVAIPGDRIQVVFGGYRATPQVELWVVPQDGPMPEFKAEERPGGTQPED